MCFSSCFYFLPLLPEVFRRPICSRACCWPVVRIFCPDIRFEQSRPPAHHALCSPLELRLACSDAALCLANEASGIETALELVNMAVEPSASQMSAKTAAVSAAIALLARHRLQLRRETGAEDTAMSLLFPLILHKDAAWDYSAVAVRERSRYLFCRIVARIVDIIVICPHFPNSYARAARRINGHLGQDVLGDV